MKTKLLPCTLLMLAVLTTPACSQPGTPVPPLAPQVSGPQAPSGPVEFPPLTKPGRIFGSPEPLVYPLSHYTVTSRFVLYYDGTFALQVAPTLEWPGRYSEVDGIIQFIFDSYAPHPDDGAKGTLTGDKLTVRYAIHLSLSDFEDAIYTLQS